ncbi:MAG: molybdopterin-guanine dinucleotide biosynthesis protein B [Pseudomonadota bacterium]
MANKNYTPVIQIVGHPGCGKTTLMVELIEGLIAKGISVATLKHSAHNHELDKPGKDSFLHRQAGANPAVMMSGTMSAIYFTRKNGQSPDDLIRQYLSGVDIVLIEGWISGPYKKIEVFRKGCSREPLFNSVDNVKAFITDTCDCLLERELAAKKGLAVYDRSAEDCFLNFILSLAKYNIIPS